MRVIPVLGLLLLVAVLPCTGSEPRESSPKASLVTIVGTVRAVSELAGEGDIVVVAISLAPEGAAEEVLEVLLAPAKALADTGFAVAVGDRAKVRVFSNERGPAKAHKILNITQDTMVRVRTLHQVPLWDSTGAWQGGPCSRGQGVGARGPRYRGGR